MKLKSSKTITEDPKWKLSKMWECRCIVIIRSLTIATYPSVGGRCETHGCVFQERKNAQSRHQRLFEKNVGKTGKVQSTNFNCERFEICFYTRRRYQHPTRPSQGTTAFNQVCNIMSSSCFIFPFLHFYVLLCLLYFFIFLWSTRVFPLLLRIPQLR